MIEVQQLSDRAKHRIRIAARFLRQWGFRFGSNFYGGALRAIETLDTKRRAELRSLVDWLEEYEVVEREVWGSMAAAPAPAKPSLQKRKTVPPALKQE